MTGIYFPAGSRIDSFSVETFVFQRNGAVTYLVCDAGGKKFFLTIPGEEFSGEALTDIEIFSGVRDPLIVPVTKVVHSPIPCVVSACVEGLSLDDCRVAEKNFTIAEAEQIICSLTAAVEKLCAAGCRRVQINTQNTVIDSAGAVHIFCDCGKNSGSTAAALRSVLKEVCFLSDTKDLRIKQLCKRLDALPVDCSVADVSRAAVFPGEADIPYRAPRGWKKLGAYCFAGAAVAAAAAGAVMWFSPKTDDADAVPAVTVAEIKANYHSSGPVIHELEAEKKEAVEKLEIPVQKAVRKIVKKKVEKPKVKKPVVKQAPPVKKPAPEAEIAAAAKRGNLMDLRTLISARKDVNLKDRDGHSALYYAAAANWRAMIDLLVKAGAKITAAEINAGNINTARYLQQLRSRRPGNRPQVKRKVPRRNVVQRPQHAAVRPIPNTSGWRKAPRKNWHITLESAARNALRQRRKIFVLFTGADWCGPCKSLKKNALDTAEFRRLTRNVEIVYLDFPRASDRKFPVQQRNYNTRIRRELRGGGGVPQVLILDWRGNRIGAIGGFGRKEAFFNRLKPLLKR